jgi:hypothetical protein
MSGLNEVLADFSTAIIYGDEPAEQITANYANYSAAIAVEVYRNNFRGNLHDTLAGAYPVIEQLVGRDFFRLLTRKFIEQHPSRSGNLHNYGEQMASFVAQFPAAQGLPYLPDVASLEWACHRAYFAEDASRLDIAKLGQISPEQYADLILSIHPACHVVRSAYPIVTIWHAHQPGAASDFRIDLGSGASNALVSRKDDVVRVGELTEAETAWLQAIQAGASLGEATDATLERHPDFVLQAMLLNLLAQDILTGFYVRDTP